MAQEGRDWIRFGWAILPLMVIGAVLAIRYKPSDDAIARDLEVRFEEGAIECRGIAYSCTWGPEVVHEGDIRQIVRAFNPQAPIITRDAVVTTGEFSNPDIVQIAPLKKGSTRWWAERRPEGTLVVLHLIPSSPEIQDFLEDLEEGDRAAFTGHEEADGRIENSVGGFVALGHANHKFLLVTGVEAVTH